MKKIKVKFFKTSNALIAGLIALLGFASSCIKPKVEYGTPHAKFIVNGKVISSDSKEAIENIQVIMQWDTTKTDSEGRYQVIDYSGFPVEQTFNIKFLDIDGAANGEFQDLDTLVEFKNPQFVGGDRSWYSGETSTEFEIELNPKK